MRQEINVGAKSLAISFVLAAMITAITIGAAAAQPAPADANVATFAAKPITAPAIGTPEVITITPELIAAAKKEGELSIMYSGQQDTSENIFNAFGKQYGIKLSFNRQVGAAGTQAFATQERAGRHQSDIHITTDGAGFVQLINERLFANYTLPNVAQEIPDIARVDGWGYAPYYLDIVNSYNSKLVTTAQAKKLLTDWNGLLDPAFAGGKLGMLKPSSASQSLLLSWMWLTDPRYGISYLRKLAAQKPVFFEGSGPAREALAAGEISVLVGDNGANTTDSFIKGGDLNWQWPNLAARWASTFHAISAHAPHPAAARLFIAWTFSADGAKAIAATNESSTLKSFTTLEIVATPKLQKTDWWPGEFSDKTIWKFDKYEFFNPAFIRELIGKFDAIFGING